jgi:RHS repeat-associated protein
VASWSAASLYFNHARYDGENRLAQTTVNAASVTYAYDGEGRRVKRTAGGQTTVYVYSATGELAAEYGGETNGGGTQYLTVDALGSTRLVTKADAGVVCRTDYLPYGEEIPAGKGGRSALWGACSGVRQKFTGKERDAETGLDYFGARYFSGAQGRFTSPDPLLNSGRPWEPQSWNRYAYALNNPLKYVDPDGLWEWASGPCDDQCQANRTRFIADVEAARKAATYYAKGSNERKALDRVLKAIGNENEKTGLKVAFGSLEGRVGAAYSPRTGTMTIDYGKNDARFDARPDLETAGFSREGENVSSIIHEGTHRADNAGGYDFGIQVGGPNQARDLRRLFNAESTAYGNQILFHRATDTRPLTFRELWNSSWSTVDQQTINSAVGRKAQESVDYVKKDLGIK